MAEAEDGGGGLGLGGLQGMEATKHGWFLYSENDCHCGQPGGMPGLYEVFGREYQAPGKAER